MIKSMTGYGKASCDLSTKTVTIEIRSLNSKQLDISARLPQVYKDKEIEIRNLFSGMIERGKVELFLNVEGNSDRSNIKINKGLVRNYFTELKSLANEMNISEGADLLSLIFKMPDVLVPENEELDDEEWKAVKETLLSAIKQLDAFRISEGKSIEEEFRKRIDKIKHFHEKIIPYEEQRMKQLKERIQKDMRELEATINIDENRFQQELFYYIEKMDITEEKVRLAKHCDYFMETISAKEANGKKLNFISQEIGREINTLGSKAMDADIQKIIVQMKDELEKIKEQLGNVL